MTTVILESLSKRYGGATALDAISVSVGEGEFVSLLGPSGCGKSTTLRLIAGFDQSDGGRILFDGQDVSALPPEKRDIGMVFQSYALFPHMTVAGNLSFGLEMRGIDRTQRRLRVKRALDMVRLDDMADRYPRALSGGQQQRVALARALVIEPRILLLDEPLANLDAKLRDEMRVFIRELQHRVGITTLYVTHDQGEAMAMSDRVVVMFDGGIAQCGTPRTIYEQPANRAVATFIGQANLLVGTVRLQAGMRVVDTALGCRPLMTGAPGEPGSDVLVMLRPEALELASDDSDCGLVSGLVQGVQYGGNLSDYRIGLADGEQVQVQRFGPPRQVAGGTVALRLSPDPLWALQVPA